MKKIINNKVDEPDYKIELSHGDKVFIYKRDKDVLFDFFCDGTGNCFTLTKQELKELLK